MHHVKLLFVTIVTIGLLVTSVHADFKVTIPNVEVTSDGVNPTTGSFPILLEVDGIGAPNVNAPISSYNFQLDVTSVSGGLTTVTSLTASEGDLFASVPSQEFTFSTFSQGTTPLGYSNGASTIGQPTAPAPATANSPIVLTNIAFSIPAGQTGSFSVDFVPNSFEIYDDSLPTSEVYAGVTATGGTITAIPEPSAFLLLSVIGSVAIVGTRLRRQWRTEKN